MTAGRLSSDNQLTVSNTKIHSVPFQVLPSLFSILFDRGAQPAVHFVFQVFRVVQQLLPIFAWHALKVFQFFEYVRVLWDMLSP
jgi:hypothetical protein